MASVTADQVNAGVVDWPVLALAGVVNVGAARFPGATVTNWPGELLFEIPVWIWQRAVTIMYF